MFNRKPIVVRTNKELRSAFRDGIPKLTGLHTLERINGLIIHAGAAITIPYLINHIDRVFKHKLGFIHTE